MRASLIIEAIGHDFIQTIRLCSAKLDSLAPGLGAVVLGTETQFARWGVWEIGENASKRLYGKTDYSQANSKGSRGVRICYLLESGKRYFVKAPISWKRTDEYFCHITEVGEIVREKTVSR